MIKFAATIAENARHLSRWIAKLAGSTTLYVIESVQLDGKQRELQSDFRASAVVA